MKRSIVVLMVVVAAVGQEQQPPIQDLNLLIGKEVIVQRVPLCPPGTYTHVLAYAGKQARVVSLKPLHLAALPQSAMNRLPPETRATLEDYRKSATILVQFEDQTQLDTCTAVPPSRLQDYFELVPGQILQSNSPAPPPASAPAAATVATSAPMAVANSIPGARPDVLSDEEVKMALTGKGKEHAVEVVDMGLMAAQGKEVPHLVLYMPEAVLAMRSESAKQQFTQYQPSEEDQRRSLMIVAHGYVSNTITEGCTSITRIVLLSDPSGGVVREAYLTEPLGETWRNNFGATNECQALRAKFSLDDVYKVREAAPNGEFLVAVFSGSVKTKIYKIKKKHQSKLGLK